MKNCVSCQSELPGSAVHCVFCGAKQPKGEAPPNSPNNKTMMGFPGMQAELIKQVRSGSQPAAPMGSGPQAASPQAAKAQPSGHDPTVPVEALRRPSSAPIPNPASMTPRPGSYGPGPSPSGPAPSGPMQGQPPMGGPMQGQPPMGGPMQGRPPMQGQPPVQGQPPMGGPMQGQPPMGGPMQGRPPMQGQPPMGAPMQGQPPMGAPMQGQPPMGAPMQGQPMGGPGQGQPMAHNPAYRPGPSQPPGHGPHPGPSKPLSGFDPRPQTELVKPLKAPEYLASDSLNRAVAPLDPWSETTKTLLLVYGVLLIACFVAPWSVGAQTTFSWSMFKAPSVAFMLPPILIIASGVLAIVLGAIPLSSFGRGIAMAVVGAGPLLALASLPPFQWRGLVGLFGVLLIVVGLLVRSRYTRNSLGRILATVGVLAVLALYLIPVGGQIPLIATFKALGTQPIAPTVIFGGGGFGSGIVPLVLTLLALLVWLPGPGSGGANILAWVIIVYGIVASLVVLLMGDNMVDVLKSGLAVFIYLPVAMSAWLAFAGYGGATIIGKQLESG